MSLSNIIGGMLAQGMSRQSHNRLRTGAENADRSGGIEQMLGAFLGGGRGGAAGRTTGAGGLGGLADMARDFLNKPQAGGMSGAKIGGIGALAGGLLGGGLRGAAKGGVMAILGTLALQALRGQHPGASAATGTAAGSATPMRAGEEAEAAAGSMTGTGAGATALPPPTQEEVEAMTDARAERLVLRAMIGAAQVDGHVSDAEMQKIMGGMNQGDVTEEERRMVRDEVSRPVDVEAIGREATRPEVAAEVYLGALMAVDIDTESERDYFRRLARALRLEPDVIHRLHRLTGAPAV